MLNTLAGKKILLVAPEFFSYAQAIQGELELLGATVDWVLDRPFKSALMKGITTINRQLVMGAVKKYYKKKLTDYARNDYDIVLVVNGQTLSPQILSAWRQDFPGATFILYIWDSLNNRQTIKENFEFFDCCLSFDKQDAKQYGLEFLPLFFSKGFEQPKTTEILYDVSFIGTAHTNRYSVASMIAQSLSKKVRFYKYFYLQSQWVYYYYKTTNPTFKLSSLNDFNFKPLDKTIVQQIFMQSTAILDIEHPLQSGLTMRSLEALGAKKKLITTNKNIVNYDFYTPNNILILNRNLPKINEKFFYEPYQDIDNSVYKKYSITGWLNQLLKKASLLP